MKKERLSLGQTHLFGKNNAISRKDLSNFPINHETKHFTRPKLIVLMAEVEIE